MNFDVRGHHFVHYNEGKIPGVHNARRIYCQQCCYGIWIYLQSSLHCRQCGFSVHTTCADGIMRQCVAEKVRTEPTFIMKISPEKSLAELNYRCVECDVKFSQVDPRREARLCDYTGLSFCAKCHWNALSITPARVLQNWQFEEFPVSQAAKQYLFLMYSKPVLNVAKENSKLFAVVPELSEVHKMRETIVLMKKYLTVCRIAMDQKILLILADRQHFVDGSDYYSLRQSSTTKETDEKSFLNFLFCKLLLWSFVSF